MNDSNTFKKNQNDMSRQELTRVEEHELTLCVSAQLERQFCNPVNGEFALGRSQQGGGKQRAL